MILQNLKKFLYKLTGSGEKIGEYKGRYFRILIITFFILILPYFLPEIEVEKENLRYLLSSISQGLAAVFALVITISLILTGLVFANMQEPVDSFIKLEFRPLTLFFYAFFIFSIIFPLLLLAQNRFDPPYIKLSLSSAIICLYGTVEFTLGFKQKIEILRNSQKNKRS